ncbi:DUF4276 family protein [candidate division KSB1 bacterium]|nr:DUF4276 family protein [candidate division KSB1 bacterium]
MNRITVICIVEGQTENAFLKILVAPYLGSLGIDFYAPIVGVGSGKGGVKYLRAEKLYGQIHKHLLDPRQPFVTMFFDYYAFPSGESKGWGFVDKIKSEANFRSAEFIVKKIEEELKRQALEKCSISNAAIRFLPYLQLYEMEALYFSDPELLAETFGDPSLEKTFYSIVQDCKGCEHINDNPVTAPSKRIQSLYSGYKKGRSDMAHAPRIAQRIKLDKVRSKCPRFNQWLEKLE